ncbi:MAG: T9SS type A sorting domain-containing protein [Flavobacteriales bacterium]
MVKNYILPILASSLLAITQVSAQAPLVTLTNAAQEVVNGTTVQVNAGVTDMDQLLGMGLSAENTSGTSRLVNVKRYETSVLHGTSNYFCWDVCYGERNAGAYPLWVAADPVSMAAGEMANGFHAYYKPQVNTGTSTFRYVWYDMNSPNDSTWVDFEYNVTEASGIAEVVDVRAFKVFPNPSTGGDITINYDLATATSGTQMELYNVLGERKLVQPISAAQGKITLREGELNSGVWFAVLKRNGKTLATKRLVVAR